MRQGKRGHVIFQGATRRTIFSKTGDLYKTPAGAIRTKKGPSGNHQSPVPFAGCSPEVLDPQRQLIKKKNTQNTAGGKK